MTTTDNFCITFLLVSTHMPLARHDGLIRQVTEKQPVSTHMPLARHDAVNMAIPYWQAVSTHMPLARHDLAGIVTGIQTHEFLLTCLLRGMTA